MALIPARAGSKGIPGKNGRYFQGEPLVSRAARIGRATCDRVYLSSDSREYAEMVTDLAEWIVRPPELAQDETPMHPVVLHALHAVEPWRPDVVVVLQPTQPLRTVHHVRAALALLDSTGADSVVSVVQIPAHYSPDYAMRIDLGQLSPWTSVAATRRQDARPAYSRDGTVYAVRRHVVLAGSLYGDDCRPLVLPEGESCNLDTEEDWLMAHAKAAGE